jgi:hypothetical protein
MRELKEEKRVNPSFVAPEWDEQIFYQIKSQRTDFLEMIKKEWDFLTPTEARDISLSLAYEGDAYEEVFGKLPVVWLDNGRKADEDTITNFSKLRMGYLKRRIIDEKDSQNFLNKLSTEVRKDALKSAGDNPSFDKERDRIFFEAIENQSVSVNKDTAWGVIVVGSNHASDHLGSMRNLLELRGHKCVMKFIDSLD